MKAKTVNDVARSECKLIESSILPPNYRQDAQALLNLLHLCVSSSVANTTVGGSLLQGAVDLVSLNSAPPNKLCSPECMHAECKSTLTSL